MKKNKPYGAAAALLAGALLGGLMTAPGAHAVDFRVKGVWIAMLEYGDGGSFVRKDREGKNVQGWGRWGEDRFEAKNRVRLQLDAAVSDALSGSVYFEIGGATWGRARSGGALGADGQIVKIKHSYLDWTPARGSRHAWACSASSCPISSPMPHRSSMPTWPGSASPLRSRNICP